MTDTEFFDAVAAYAPVFGGGVGVGISICFAIWIGLASMRVVTEFFRN